MCFFQWQWNLNEIPITRCMANATATKKYTVILGEIKLFLGGKLKLQSLPKCKIWGFHNKSAQPSGQPQKGFSIETIATLPTYPSCGSRASAFVFYFFGQWYTLFFKSCFKNISYARHGEDICLRQKYEKDWPMTPHICEQQWLWNSVMRNRQKQAGWEEAQRQGWR